MQLLNILLAIVLSLAPLSTYQQARIPGPGGAGSGGGGGGTGSYTGQNCSNGTGTATTVSCSASMTVSTGDLVAVYGTTGNLASTLSSCSTSAGTATVTWTVDTAASNAHDASQNETSGTCHGAVSSGGSLTPAMTWSGSGSDGSIVAIAFSGLKNTIDGGGNITAAVATTGANAVSSGSITTTVNGDTLFGGTADTSGSAATLSAGTTSVTFTKILCNSAWGGQTCVEWGNQTTAGASTQANWTYSAADRMITSIIAIEHN